MNGISNESKVDSAVTKNYVKSSGKKMQPIISISVTPTLMTCPL